MDPTSRDHSIGDSFLAAFAAVYIVIAVLANVAELLYSPYAWLDWTVGFLVLGVGSLSVAIAETRATHRARELADAFAKIEEGAQAVSNTRSEADRARALVK